MARQHTQDEPEVNAQGDLGGRRFPARGLGHTAESACSPVTM